MQEENNLTDNYDKEFFSLITEIDKHLQTINKHDKIRIESWCKKLCQITNNTEWKKNRNLHAIYLLNMLINKSYEEPYNKFVPEGPLPILSKTLVTSKLTPKFWKRTKKIYQYLSGIDENTEQHYSPQEYDYINDNNNHYYNYNQNEEAENRRRYYSHREQHNNNNHHREYYDKDNEIERLENIIIKLQNDLIRKEQIIQQQHNDKINLTKRLNELEKIISSFISSQKS